MPKPEVRGKMEAEIDPEFISAIGSWLQRLRFMVRDRKLNEVQLRDKGIDSRYTQNLRLDTLIRLFSAFTYLASNPDGTYTFIGKKPITKQALAAFKLKLSQLYLNSPPDDAINQALDAMDALSTSENQPFSEQE